MERIKKSPRKGKILELLVHSESSITIDALVQKLAVSRRTIYREVSEINNTLLCYGLVIRNQKDQGLSLQGEPSLINKLCNFLNNGLEKTRDVDVNFRRKKLIADGLNYRSLEKLSYYSTVFKVSESTISSDLNYVEEWLKKHHLILERKPGKGIRVIGTEENIRLALKEFLCREVGSRIQSQIFELRGDPDKSIEQQIFQQLNIKPDYIFKTLKEYETEFGGLFADEAFNALVLHIAIAIRRVMDGHHVPYSVTSNIADYKKEYALAKKVSEKIADYYNIDFSDSEIYFLFLHIISTKMIKDPSIIFKLGEVEDADTVKQIADYIITMVNNTKQIVVDKVQYLDNLMMHLRPMINRIEYGLKLENPLLEMIKREYPEAYGIAWMTNAIFKRHIGKGISEDEAGFIAIHIQSMIEGIKDYVRVVIVCSSGIGISQLIATRIEARYTQVKVVSVDSVASFQQKQYSHNEIDLVLSTFPIQTELSMLLVSPLINEGDMKKIEAYIYNHATNEKNIFDSVRLETFIHPDWKSQSEIIKNVSVILEGKGLVHVSFYDRIYERERINSTLVGMSLALPHAAFDSVKKSTLAVVTLKKPVQWGDGEADLIIFIALTKNDSAWVTNVLKNMYYKLYFPQSHALLIKAECTDDILRILTE